MADYPDWVLAHKRKGTYVNRVKGRYYLYAAHSERIHGTGKVRRVSDGYLGRITEADGFIPAKRKLSEKVYVYEYGLSETVFRVSKQVHVDMRRKFGSKADAVMAAGVLMFMHGRASAALYETSGVSIRLPGLDMDMPFTDRQRAGIDTTARRIEYHMKERFGDALAEAMELLPLVRKASMAGDARLAKMPAAVAAFLNEHGLDFEEDR